MSKLYVHLGTLRELNFVGIKFGKSCNFVKLCENYFLWKLLENCQFTKFAKSDFHRDFKVLNCKTHSLQKLAGKLYVSWLFVSD